MQIGHTLRELQAHVGAVKLWQLHLPNVQEVVQGAAREVLCDQAQVRNLQASPNKADQPLVSQVPEGLDLFGELLYDDRRVHRVVPVELFDRNLLPLAEAPEDLPKLTRSKMLDELKLPISYSLLGGQLTLWSLG